MVSFSSFAQLASCSKLQAYQLLESLWQAQLIDCLCQLHVFLFFHSLQEPWVGINIIAWSGELQFTYPTSRLLGGKLHYSPICLPLLFSWVSFIVRVALCLMGELHHQSWCSEYQQQCNNPLETIKILEALVWNDQYCQYL